jgi:hypothetical protein
MLLIGLTAGAIGMSRSITISLLAVFAMALAGPMSAAFGEEAPLPPPRPPDLTPTTTPTPATSPLPPPRPPDLTPTTTPSPIASPQPELTPTPTPPQPPSRPDLTPTTTPAPTASPPPSRPPELTPTPTPAASPAPLGGSEKADQTCLAKLVASGAGAEAATIPQPIAEGCGVTSPVRLQSIVMANGDVVGLPGGPILGCEFALVFADYVRLVMAPLGAGTLGTKVDSIETGPGYQCRNRNNFPSGKISAHAKGIAIDLMAVRFADKRRVAWEHQDGANEASYIRATRAAACGWFTTVLGPGTDPFHAAHMHVDIESHGSNGSYRICQ